MKKWGCVCFVALAAIGFCSLAFFFIFLETQVMINNIYRAAVLEVVLNRNLSLSFKDLVIKNLETYVSAVKIAYVHDVDVIVFPENGFLGSINERDITIYSIMENIPDPKEQDYVPCSQNESFNNSPILRIFSCLAQYGGMYIIANMIDYKPCNDSSLASENCVNTNCPDDGIYLFNTNVVFNKVGKLVARYHKRHLLFEDYLNPSICNGDGYFQTEFGKFLTSIGTDLFYEESNKAILKHSPDTIIYTTCCKDYTPLEFLSSPLQQSYAFTRNINLLSANMYNNITRELISVIYSGTNGPLIVSNGPYKHNTLLISNVPKNPKDYNKHFNLRRKKFIISGNNYYEVNFKESEDLEENCDSRLQAKIDKIYKGSYCFPINSTDLNSVKLKNYEDFISICMNGLCCSLTYKARRLKEDYFFLVSSYNDTSSDGVTSKYESCILTRCKSLDGKNCTYLSLKSKSIFDEVQVKGVFRSRYVFYAALNSGIKIIEKSEYEFDRNSSISYKNLHNNSLLTFGLFGRKHK